MILYSTGCPRCSVLKSKLDSKKIEYTIVADMDTLLKLGLKSVPVLETDNGELLNFSEAVKYVNSLGGN